MLVFWNLLFYPILFSEESTSVYCYYFWRVSFVTSSPTVVSTICSNSFQLFDTILFKTSALNNCYQELKLYKNCGFLLLFCYCYYRGITSIFIWLKTVCHKILKYIFLHVDCHGNFQKSGLKWQFDLITLND